MTNTHRAVDGHMTCVTHPQHTQLTERDSREDIETETPASLYNNQK